MPQGSVGIGRLDARYERKFMKNVQDYGAAGDGVTDDTAAANAAIAAAASLDTVFFPTGYYYLTSTLTNAKNLTIQGSGPGTHIFMANDLDLFDTTAAGYFRYRDMRLGSAAVSADKCLIKLGSATSHGLIENVFMIGGYYGIGAYGSMFNRIIRPVNTSTFYRSGTSSNQAWIYGERSGGHSINGWAIRDALFQGGVRGIHIAETNNEGTILINGGLIEGQTSDSILLTGIGQFAEISGIHFESSGARINLSNCRNIKISGFTGGTPGVWLQNCRRVSISDSYVQGITVDADCRNIDIDRVFYNAALDISGSMVRIRNAEDTGNAARGGYGYYTGERPSSLVNGDLETWAGGAPDVFAVVGSVAQETTIVKEGSSSAKVTTPGGQLRYNLDPDMFSHCTIKPITVSAWAYKPASGGGDPRITMYYNSGATSTPSPSFSLTADTWTRITATFYVPGSGLVDGHVRFWCASTGDVYFDDIVISEEMF